MITKFSEIEQSAAEFYVIGRLKIWGPSPTMDFMISTFQSLRCLLGPLAYTYTFLAKSDYPRLSSQQRDNASQRCVNRTTSSLANTFQHDWPMRGCVSDDYRFSWPGFHGQP